MAKIRVYSKARGVRSLRDGVTLEQYKIKFPDAIQVKVPCVKTLEKWSSDCGCKTIDGCWVEPDGTCEHGFPSWLLAMNLI
jgi:hypothetical protein